jgi:hypothetical protein
MNNEEKQLYALDALSQMCYFSRISNEYLAMCCRMLPPSKLKDVVMHYRENQQNWENKLLRSLKDFGKFADVDLYSSMKKDLDSGELVAMFDIISNLKKTVDMEGVATIVEECSGLEDLDNVKTNIIAIIRNEKSRRAANKEKTTECY